MVLPANACGVLCTVNVMLTVLPNRASRLVCAVSLVSKNAVIFPVQLFSVAMFIAQLPEAPKGVTSFTAPFRLSVHFDAFVNNVEASVHEAPTPAKAVNVFSPSYYGTKSEPHPNDDRSFT